MGGGLLEGAAADADRPAPAWQDGRPIVTGFGGVFYLVNMMLLLGLPDCFEEDWRLASRLGHWGTLEALGRGLVGLLSANSPDGATAQADPLWAALRELGGLDPGQLGTGLQRPDVYVLPATWPRASGETVHRERSGRSYRARSDAGYLLWESRAATGPGLAQSGQRRRPAALARLPSSLVARFSPALAAWLRRVLPYLRWWLKQQLDPASDRRVLAMLATPARVYAGGSHVDVVMSLDAISIEARLAGLDRDPGWQPAFGRVIKLYFQ